MEDQDNPDFVGRGGEIKRVYDILNIEFDKRFTGKQARVALYGPAGAG